MVILVQRKVDCVLEINSEIDGVIQKEEIIGNGYYKSNDEEIVVYFTNSDNRFKYVYSQGVMKVFFNDSCYNFKDKHFMEGEIKNGDYVFKITTFALNIELNDNFILLDYTLSQNNITIGNYKTKLSFK